jgi:hypothetical protein
MRVADAKVDVGAALTRFAGGVSIGPQLLESAN